jgi:hypothetical protein
MDELNNAKQSVVNLNLQASFYLGGACGAGIAWFLADRKVDAKRHGNNVWDNLLQAMKNAVLAEKRRAQIERIEQQRAQTERTMTLLTMGPIGYLLRYGSMPNFVSHPR